MSKKILVADDDFDICNLLKTVLEAEGYNVITASNGQDAVNAVNDNKDIDLIILDIVMPLLYGTEAAVEIRKTSACPILFLTARLTDQDKIEAYGSGGDDYLQKPFSTVELALRVKALLKRSNSGSGETRFDYGKGLVKIDGRTVKLTDKEARFFKYLYENKGKALSVQSIYEQVWEDKYMPSSNDTVMVFVLKLRKKLEQDYTNPRHIITVWGRGYKYEE